MYVEDNTYDKILLEKLCIIKICFKKLCKIQIFLCYNNMDATRCQFKKNVAYSENNFVTRKRMLNGLRSIGQIRLDIQSV